MIIDAHIHLWDRLHGDDFGLDREGLTWGWARQGDKKYLACPPAFDDSRSTYERALAYMDATGIDRAVVLQEFMDGKQDDYLAQVRKLAPERFSCMSLFDKAFFEDPLTAFKVAIDEKKLQGFLVKTPDPFPEVATRQLEPVWKACAERGLPVVLKNGAPDEIARLIKMAPGIKVVLSHFAGSGGPADDYEARLRLCEGSPDVYIDAGAITFRHRYPFAKSQQLLQGAVERVGADKISWGSDYPRPGLVVDSSYKQQLEFITVECDFLTDVQRAQILGLNALKIYPWESAA